MIRAAVIALALLAGLQAPAAQPMRRSEGQAADQAVGTAPAVGAAVLLRGLDTLNGTARDIPAGIGQPVRYGHLEIVVESCRASRGDAGDAAAYLRIRDIREEGPRFEGWMFAASPALSALDHPRYDVWLRSCNRA